MENLIAERSGPPIYDYLYDDDVFDHEVTSNNTPFRVRLVISKGTDIIDWA